MSVNRIASRYAKSVLDLAKERSELDVVLSDMKGVQQAAKNRDLYLLLKSPFVKPGKKLQIFETLFEGKISKLSMEFFRIILKKGREQYIPEIATQFVDQYKKMKHISSISLTTAEAIDPAIINGIEEKLLASDATDQHIEIISKVDPDIIGGFMIEIGDKLYDDSVKGKLEKLRKTFSKNDYEKAY